jgi:capsular exopolysaccharide synthesis family protein
MYKAVASLEIQGVNENFLNLRDIDPTATPAVYSNAAYVQTQAEILQQNSLIAQVATKLKLDQRPEFKVKPSRWKKMPPEQYVVEAVKAHLTIAPSRGDSRVIRIVYEARDPQLAADFANSMATTFIEQSVEARQRAAQQIREWLSPQLQEFRNKLQKAEGELDTYARASGLMFTTGQQSLAEEKLRALQNELSKAQTERIATQAQFELISANRPETASDNPVVRDYELKLTDLRRQLADLESVFQPESFKVTRVKAQIGQLEAALQRELRRGRERLGYDYKAAYRRERDLASAYANQSEVVSNLSAKVTHYNTLKHEVDTDRVFYEAMLQKVNEAGVASAVRQSNIRFIGPAEPALEPYKPNTPLNIAIGLFTGLVLGIGYVMLRQQTNPRLQEPGDAGLYLHLPELGAIPKAGYGAPALAGLGNTFERGAEQSLELITWEQRFSGMSESFRSSLTSLLARSNGHRPHVMVVTSSLPMEGKTTVISNLAIALAEISRKVLLIDGDMRRPRLHTVFNLPNSWGLSDLLRESGVTELPMDALVKKTAVPRLHLLPSGPCPESIFSLLYSERMGRLIERFRSEFDYVLVDAPPCLEFADARILARHSEGVILILRANYTDRKRALLAAQRLLMDGIPVLGTILNNWDPISTKNAYGYSAYQKVYDQNPA